MSKNGTAGSAFDFKRLMMVVLWPSFLMASIAVGFVFSLVDPDELVVLGQTIKWSNSGIYTVSFFIFWVLGSIASGLTALLMIEMD